MPPVPRATPIIRFLSFGRSAGGALAAPMGRDARIDVVRGLALLVIFINHMPGNVVSGYMPHNFGFSDAADIFVLLAGVSATLAYGNLIERRGLPVAALRIGARIGTLYIAHISVFIIVCGVVAAAVTRTQNPLYVEAINIQPFFNDTFEALVDALTLRYQPSYLDILPLYIVLLALFPAIYHAVRVSPLATLVVSLAIWQLALAMGWNFPNTRSNGWFFNPFAWQVVFTLGVVIGRALQLGIAAPRSRRLDLLALGFIAFAWHAKTASGNPLDIALLNDWFDAVQLGSDKTNLSWAHLAHVLAVSWLAIRWLPKGGTLLSFGAGRVLARMGRHSLEVFWVGIVLSIVGQIVLAEFSFAPGAQLFVCLGGTTLLAGLGVFLSWYQSITLRSSAAETEPAPGVPAARR
ncbi:MAG: hypothetical protein DI527_13760 [Chelatococcus sp.]|nr:MAG: hypothetical protein DI527_13760 [Chelatococcus sp.]